MSPIALADCAITVKARKTAVITKNVDEKLFMFPLLIGSKLDSRYFNVIHHIHSLLQYFEKAIYILHALKMYNAVFMRFVRKIVF